MQLRKNNITNALVRLKTDQINLGQVQGLLSTIIKFFFKHFNVLAVSNKNFYGAIKRSLRTITFNLFGILPLTIWRALFLIQENLLIQYFKKERVRVRLKKKRSLVTFLKKVPGYMYYGFFLRRNRTMPLAMPKESSFYKKSVTTNFTFKLHYKHLIRLDRRAVRE